jgi:hypothetical protein
VTQKRIRNDLLLSIIVILTLSLVLAWVSSGFESIQGWGLFLAVLILGVGILFGGWLALRNESEIPAWLSWLLIGTAVLRLVVGVIWFIALPRWGQGTEPELAGYVMADAHQRDIAAWELAQSSASLFTAFQDYRLADQYGGLLFASAAVYRCLGGDVHHPLLIVVITAAFSALAVPFAWALTRRLWDEDAAKPAAWIMALYPEAVLLGSSQMREAFMMTLAAVAVYGLVLYWQERNRSGLIWVFAVLLLGVPLSSLFAIWLIGTLIFMLIVLNRGRIFRNWRVWAVLGVLLVIGVGGMWFMADQIFPQGAANPWDLVVQWLKYAAQWEAYTAERSSGWVQKIFRLSPEWLHPWLLLGYGTMQPFLPAALIATGNPVWRVIALWRSVGWTLLLFLLVYAPFRAVRRFPVHWLAVGMSLVVWAGVFISAYRGGGDQWDNPRYRVMFIVLQVALAGWVWSEQRRESDPWLRRIIVVAGLVLAWFIPWYVRRYYPQITWTVVDVFKTLGLGLASAVLYGVWDWARNKDC